MSAIFGVWHRTGRPVDRVLIERMSSRLEHRGRDAHGIWGDGPVALGTRLRRTTPESLREFQPLVGAGGHVVLSTDARIDNREELLPLTDLRSCDPATVTDADLVLAAYEKWGRDCLPRLLGDFAFALWDAREESLLLARDVMGVRPLYYHVSDRVVAFASEIKALLALPDVPRRINELHVARYLEGIIDEREQSFYDSIIRVPAAHSVRIRRHDVDVRRYWRLEIETEIRLRSDAEFAEALRELFSRSVSCRLRSAFPVGSTLSGGLDSSSVASMARDQLTRGGGQRLRTFSAVFPALPEEERKLADESPYIDAVLATGGFDAERIAVDGLGPFFELSRVFWHLDEAPIAYNLYMHWALYGAAQRCGVRVFLDGFDGDACVGYGRDRFTELIAEGNWDGFESEIRAVCAVLREEGSQPRATAEAYALPHLRELARAGRWRAWVKMAGELAERFDSSRWTLVSQYAARPVFAQVLGGVRLRRASGAPRRSLISRALAERIGSMVEPRPAEEPVSGPQRSRAAHRRGLELPAYQHILEVADGASSAFELDVRYPFFDRRLMQFCVSLPSDQKLARGWPRLVLRRAMEGILPPAVQWRARKQDLSPSLLRGLRGPGRWALDRLATGECWPGVEYLDRSLVADRYHRFVSGGDRQNERADALALYRAAVLSEWLRGGVWETPLEGGQGTSSPS